MKTFLLLIVMALFMSCTNVPEGRWVEQDGRTWFHGNTKEKIGIMVVDEGIWIIIYSDKYEYAGSKQDIKIEGKNFSEFYKAYVYDGERIVIIGNSTLRKALINSEYVKVISEYGKHIINTEDLSRIIGDMKVFNMNSNWKLRNGKALYVIDNIIKHTCEKNGEKYYITGTDSGIINTSWVKIPFNVRMHSYNEIIWGPSKDGRYGFEISANMLDNMGTYDWLTIEAPSGEIDMNTRDLYLMIKDGDIK